MTVDQRYPDGATPDAYNAPDPYQQFSSETHQGHAIDPWERLRFRWEDQLRALAPATWTLIAAELGEVEKRYRAMADDLSRTAGELGAAHSRRATELRDAEGQRDRALERVKTAESTAQQERDWRTEHQRAKTEAETNAAAIARSLHDLGNRVAGPKQTWRHLVDGDTIKLVEQYFEATAEDEPVDNEASA